MKRRARLPRTRSPPTSPLITRSRFVRAGLARSRVWTSQSFVVGIFIASRWEVLRESHRARERRNGPLCGRDGRALRLRRRADRGGPRRRRGVGVRLVVRRQGPRRRRRRSRRSGAGAPLFRRRRGSEHRRALLPARSAGSARRHRRPRPLSRHQRRLGVDRGDAGDGRRGAGGRRHGRHRHGGEPGHLEPPGLPGDARARRGRRGHCRIRSRRRHAREARQQSPPPRRSTASISSPGGSASSRTVASPKPSRCAGSTSTTRGSGRAPAGPWAIPRR